MTGRLATVGLALGVAAVAALSFGVVYALADALPHADWVSFVVGFLLVLVLASSISLLSNGSGILTVLSFIVGVMTMITTLDLPAERALARDGIPVEVIVVSHEVSAGRGSTHRYALMRPDGTRLDQGLTYRGRGGYGLEQGDRTTVLVDPAGKVPLDLASEVDPAQAAGTVWFGAGLTLLLIVAAALVGRRRARRVGSRSGDTTTPAPRKPSSRRRGRHGRHGRHL